MKHLKILFALLTLALVASCNQGASTSVNGGGGSGGAWVIPGVGTTYIYEGTSPDTTAIEFDTLTILATGQHLGGKTNVISFIQHYGSGFDTGCYAIATNGDFSFGNEENIDTLPNLILTWDSFPTGSRQTINVEPPVDTIEAGGEHIVNSDVRSFVGVENISVPAGDFSALHIRETYINIDSIPNDTLHESSSDIETSDIWFAPSAGFYVKVTINETDDGQAESQTEINLFKYSPK